MNSCPDALLSSYSKSLFYGKIMGFDIYLAILFILDGKLFCGKYFIEIIDPF